MRKTSSLIIHGRNSPATDDSCVLIVIKTANSSECLGLTPNEVTALIRALTNAKLSNITTVIVGENNS